MRRPLAPPIAPEFTTIGTICEMYIQIKGYTHHLLVKADIHDACMTGSLFPAPGTFCSSTISTPIVHAHAGSTDPLHALTFGGKHIAIKALPLRCLPN